MNTSLEDTQRIDNEAAVESDEEVEEEFMTED